MYFRKATAADIDAVAKIYEHVHDADEAAKVTVCWERGVYPTRATAEEALKRGDLYVCEVGEAVSVCADSTSSCREIVASGIINKLQVDVYADVNWEHEVADEEVCVLHTLVVEPAALRKGYGRAFVGFYEDLAREWGCPELRIDTNVRNAFARSMYAGLGYKEVGIVPTVFNGIPGVFLVMMEKWLG